MIYRNSEEGNAHSVLDVNPTPPLKTLDVRTRRGTPWVYCVRFVIGDRRKALLLILI